MQFGDFELFAISDGTFRLDGGAMFGMVPKVLWERTNPADARNRILLGLNWPDWRLQGFGKSIEAGLFPLIAMALIAVAFPIAGHYLQGNVEFHEQVNYIAPRLFGLVLAGGMLYGVFRAWRKANQSSG